MRERKIEVDEKLAELHRRYIEEMRQKEEYKIRTFFGQPIAPRLPQDFLSVEDVEEIAERNNVAVIVISRISGEGADRKAEEGDFYLAKDERSLIEKVSRAFRTRRRWWLC